MSGNGSPVGYALYFIDVLACLLFCITLTLVGARFSSETMVPVDLPELAPTAGTVGRDEAISVTLREERGEVRFYLGDRAVSFQALGDAFRREPKPTVRIRAEETALARVIGLAHENGVHDIELAYERKSRPRAGSDGGP
ncbi:MAG: biopolymer transporter ExbD [Myxococcales bacterium]|nr:biopolymer transporter ExbD [Myxococcales bacterium]